MGLRAKRSDEQHVARHPSRSDLRGRRLENTLAMDAEPLCLGPAGYWVGLLRGDDFHTLARWWPSTEQAQASQP